MAFRVVGWGLAWAVAIVYGVEEKLIIPSFRRLVNKHYQHHFLSSTEVLKADIYPHWKGDSIQWSALPSNFDFSVRQSVGSIQIGDAAPFELPRSKDEFYHEYFQKYNRQGSSMRVVFQI